MFGLSLAVLALVGVVFNWQVASQIFLSLKECDERKEKTQIRTKADYVDMIHIVVAVFDGLFCTASSVWHLIVPYSALDESHSVRFAYLMLFNGYLGWRMVLPVVQSTTMSSFMKQSTDPRIVMRKVFSVTFLVVAGSALSTLGCGNSHIMKHSGFFSSCSCMAASHHFKKASAWMSMSIVALILGTFAVSVWRWRLIFQSIKKAEVTSKKNLPVLHERRFPVKRLRSHKDAARKVSTFKSSAVYVLVQHCTIFLPFTYAVLYESIVGKRAQYGSMVAFNMALLLSATFTNGILTNILQAHPFEKCGVYGAVVRSLCQSELAESGESRSSVSKQKPKVKKKDINLKANQDDIGQRIDMVTNHFCSISDIESSKSFSTLTLTMSHYSSVNLMAGSTTHTPSISPIRGEYNSASEAINGSKTSRLGICISCSSFE